jgi:hypothetical protein
MTVDPGSGAPMADRMQSLLSQAVEDQRSEQRQVAVALTEVRGQLARISAEIDAIRSAPGGSGSADEAVATVGRDVREAVRMLAERLDAVGRSVQERGADIAEVKVAVQDLHGAVRGHTNALAGVNQALGAVPAVGERVGGLQDNLVSLHERLAGLEELTASVDRLAMRVESADQDMRELRSAFTGMASRMAELPSRADLGAAGAQSSQPLDIIASRLARVESAIPEVLSRIDAVRERLDAAATSAGMTGGGDAGDGGTGEGGGGTAAGTAFGGGVDVAGRLDAVEAALVMLTEQLTAEPDSDDGVAADDAPDPVAEELAELREGLFGEEGLVARLESSALDDAALDERIAEAVGAAVTESERRVSEHVDVAVLALAEAIFRSGRRGGRALPVAPVSPPPAPTSAVAQDDADAETDEYDDEPDEVEASAADADLGEDADDGYDEDEADDAEDLDDSDEDDDSEEEDDSDEDGEDYGDDIADSDDADNIADSAVEGDDAAEGGDAAGSARMSAWQVPARPAAGVPPPPAPPATPATEEPKSGRRRPWWRPGD